MENTNQPSNTPVSSMKKFNEMIRAPKTQDYLESVLGNRKNSFVTSLISVMANNHDLQSCDHNSVLFTAMKATALSLPLDPNLGFAALIPYNDTKSGKKIAQFQIMRDGWVELLQRSGQLKFIANEIVHEGELIKKNKFTGEYVFDETKRKSEKIIGYMAYAELTTGFRKTVYWTKEECDAHAKQYSQTYRSTNPKVKASSKWTTDFDAMALKTVLKHLIKKYMPKSVELQNAILADQASYDSENADPNYVDGVEDQGYVETVEKAVGEQKAEMRKARKPKEVEAEVVEHSPDAEQPQHQVGGRIFNDMP